MSSHFSLSTSSKKLEVSSFAAACPDPLPGPLLTPPVSPVLPPVDPTGLLVAVGRVCMRDSLSRAAASSGSSTFAR